MQQNEIKRNIGLIYCFILLYLSYRFRKTTTEPKTIIEIRRIPITAPITMTVVEEDGPSVSIIHLHLHMYVALSLKHDEPEPFSQLNVDWKAWKGDWICRALIYDHLLVTFKSLLSWLNGRVLSCKNHSIFWDTVIV